MVPLGHIAQPAGSEGSVPHAKLEAAAHAGQQEPSVHVLPPEHIVPSSQVRHTAPVLSR